MDSLQLFCHLFEMSEKVGKEEHNDSFMGILQQIKDQLLNSESNQNEKMFEIFSFTIMLLLTSYEKLARTALEIIKEKKEQEEKLNNFEEYIKQTISTQINLIKTSNSEIREIKEQLIKNNYINTSNNHLHAAYIKNDMRIQMQYLMEINCPDFMNRIPLHYACQNCNVGTIQMLIDRHSNINEKDLNGDTPLHLAASCNRLDVVQLLLSKGANKNIRNNQNNLPSDLAINEKIIRILNG